MTPIVPSEVEKEIASSSEAPTSYPAELSVRASPVCRLCRKPTNRGVQSGASWFRKMLAFAGPGYLVAVGYMDPGNWATDIQGGRNLPTRC